MARSPAGDDGAPFGIAPIGLLGLAGGVIFFVRRRRRAEAPDPATDGVDDDGRFPGPLPVATGYDDPLLEAMALTSRGQGRRPTSTGASKAPTPITPWVKRLESEINVLADLADKPAPPARGDERPANGSGNADGDASLSA